MYFTFLLGHIQIPAGSAGGNLNPQRKCLSERVYIPIWIEKKHIKGWIKRFLGSPHTNNAEAKLLEVLTRKRCGDIHIGFEILLATLSYEVECCYWNRYQSQYPRKSGNGILPKYDIN